MPDTVNVVEFEEVKPALQFINEHKPDLIFLDIMMPKTNGLILLKALKKNTKREIRDIPVIMLTGISNKELAIETRKLGAVDYITKPFNSKVLLLKLKRNLKLTRFSHISPDN